MLRFIVILLTIILIEPALPFESDSDEFVARMLYQYILETSYSDSVADDYEPYQGKDGVSCIYDNEYCNDFPESEEPKILTIDSPSLNNSLQVIVCKGKKESYYCYQL